MSKVVLWVTQTGALTVIGADSASTVCQLGFQ